METLAGFRSRIRAAAKISARRRVSIIQVAEIQFLG